MDTPAAPSRLHAVFAQLREQLSAEIVGQSALIERLLIALLADGHLLVEGAPGLAKTTAIRALADRLEADFARVQFTPDLLPSDLTGTEVWRPQDGHFEFQPGPIFHSLLLADEINRAPAKVQSALLEAMGERQVTVGRQTYPLPRLFLVMATQNPIEQEGTFPLPEAQLDRFMLRLELGYPAAEEEVAILERYEQTEPLEGIAPVADAAAVLEQQHAIRSVPVSDPVRRYLVDVVRATRASDDVQLGASPRASLALHRGAQALAALRGRDFVRPDDVKELAVPVLAHRLILAPEARLRGRSPAEVVRNAVAKVPAPVE